MMVIPDSVVNEWIILIRAELISSELMDLTLCLSSEQNQTQSFSEA